MPDSRAQVRLAYAVLAGKSDAMPRAVAEEIVTKAKGRALPEKVKHRIGRRHV